MVSMIDWNIQSRARACQGCGQSFADQQTYHTVLLEDRAVYQRLDLCQSCWTQKAPGLAEKNVISKWQGAFETPPPPAELIQKQTAETLLRQLIERNDPTHFAPQFILAVMLERKRLLKIKDQVERDGRRWLVYEHPATGDVITVADPQLSLDQLESVQRDVAHLLEHGLPSADNLSPTSTASPTESVAEEESSGSLAAPDNRIEAPPAPAGEASIKVLS
jgi:hypothetical protein